MTPITAFVSGLGLGLCYLGILWLAAQQLPVIKHPYRLMLFNFLYRLGISLFLLYLIVESHTKLSIVAALLICCLGFLTVRIIANLLRQLGSHAAPHPSLMIELQVKKENANQYQPQYDFDL